MSTNKNTKRSDHHSKKRKQTKSSRVIHVSVYNAHQIQKNSMNLTTSHLQSMHQTTISMKKSSVSKKLRENVSKPTSSASVAPLNDRHSHLSSQSDIKKWKNNGINEDSKETLTEYQMKDRSLDQISCIYDHHRKKKKKRNVRQCFRLGILLLIITSIIISVVLPILLIKKLSKTYVATAAVLRWNSSGITVASSLVSPYGFKVDRFDTLYIAEYNAHRIRRWLSGASNGTIIAGSVNGTNGSASNQFYCPVDVLVEDNGDMYVTDRGNGRLQFWANGSSSGITVAGAGSNSSLNLAGPSGIIQDSSSKEIYIADSFHNRIVSYPTGSVLAGGNGPGYTKTKLLTPIALFYDSFSKSFIIANYGAQNIVQWTLDSGNWTLIAGGLNGISGNTSILFNQPVGVTVDPMGNVYVADALNRRIQFFLQGQSEGATIAGVTGVSGANATLLIVPYWVQLDNQLNLYVSDIGSGRIQKFLRY